MIRLLSFLCILVLGFNSSCSKPPLDINSCKHLKKTSKLYVNCMNDLIKKSNTALNHKELKKHKTLNSFFKRVIELPSE